jgi:hypothetical protein
MTRKPNLAASVLARLLNRAKQTGDDVQVRAFARRAGLKAPENPADVFMGLLEAFLSPLIEDMRLGTRRDGTWPPGGPWR